MLASSSRANSTGGPERVGSSARRAIGGVPDVLDETDHHRGHRSLAVGGRGDVDGVRRTHEPGRVEVRVGGDLEGRIGAEPGQCSRGGGPDPAELPLVGGHEAVEEVPSQLGGTTRVTGQDLLRRQGPPTIDPVQDGAHVAAVQRGGVQEGGQQRLGPFGPVGIVGPEGPLAAHGRAHLDQGTGHRERRCPRGAGLQRRPVQRVESAVLPDRSRRVEQEATTECRASGPRGVEHVGFGGGGDHWSVARQHVGDDQRCRLARARRPEDHHRMLGSDEAPAAFTVSEIRPVACAGGSGQYGAMVRSEGKFGRWWKKIFHGGFTLQFVFAAAAEGESRNCGKRSTTAINPCNQTVSCP